MLLMIDNYDSFVYNLVRYFEELEEELEVVRNDKININNIDLNKYSGHKKFNTIFFCNISCAKLFVSTITY